MKNTLDVKLPSKSQDYGLEFFDGLLKDESKMKQVLEPYGKRIAIITDNAVASLYANPMLSTLIKTGFEPYLFTFPAGEKNKTRASKAAIEDAMLENGLGRDMAILALGGGVVTDLAGFVAATYGRGVPLIMMPTTLLGMVDASLGGKNGINTSQGKNLIGTLYQPQKIIIDIQFLHSLPPKEIRNGWVEMIKHGIIADKHYFDFLYDYHEGLSTLDGSLTLHAIDKSCQIKLDIVVQDELKAGKRHVLNFGHTMGHALEITSEYELSHGEAVAIGLIVESYISLLMGYLSQGSFQQIVSILRIYGLPLHLPKTVSLESMKKAMLLDKKSLHGQPRFVMIEDISIPVTFEGRYCTTVDEDILSKALNWMLYDLCHN